MESFNIEELFLDDELIATTNAACVGPAITLEVCLNGLNAGFADLGSVESRFNTSFSERTNTTKQTGIVEFQNVSSAAGLNSTYRIRISSERVNNATDPLLPSEGSTIHTELGVSYSFERMGETGDVEIQYKYVVSVRSFLFLDLVTDCRCHSRILLQRWI